MANMTHREDLALALELADIADSISLARFRAQDLHVETKPDSSPVTDADRSVEQALKAKLTEQRPTDALIGEEFGNTDGEAVGPKRTWIIDPIDGTANFMRGVPVWASLIALAIDGKVVLSVVSAPALGRRWWAAPEIGAWTRDIDGSERILKVSAIGDLANASRPITTCSCGTSQASCQSCWNCLERSGAPALTETFIRTCCWPKGRSILLRNMT